MFQICTKTKTIQKVDYGDAKQLSKTLFEFFDDAQEALIYDINEEINQSKEAIKKIQNLTVDDVSQLGFF